MREDFTKDIGHELGLENVQKSNSWKEVENSGIQSISRVFLRWKLTIWPVWL